VSSGYIHLWRKIWDDPLFREGRKFSRFEAWVDMILMANGIEKEMLCDGKPIVIKRGQVLTSELKLANRWGWSRTKVRSFLLILLDNRKTSGKPRIKQQKDNKKSIITIINYGKYNPLKTAEKTSEKQGLSVKINTTLDNRKTSEKHQKNTNNKDKRKNKKEVLNICSQNDLDLYFEKWFKRYPRQEDKGKAKEKWLAIIEGDGEGPEILEDALSGYINWLHNQRITDLRYIKMAKTFLYNGNKKRNISPTWRQFVKYADSKYKRRPDL